MVQLSNITGSHKRKSLTLHLGIAKQLDSTQAEHLQTIRIMALPAQAYAYCKCGEILSRMVNKRCEYYSDSDHRFVLNQPRKCHIDTLE